MLQPTQRLDPAGHLAGPHEGRDLRHWRELNLLTDFTGLPVAVLITDLKRDMRTACHLWGPRAPTLNGFLLNLVWGFALNVVRFHFGPCNRTCVFYMKLVQNFFEISLKLFIVEYRLCIILRQNSELDNRGSIHVTDSSSSLQLHIQTGFGPTQISILVMHNLFHSRVHNGKLPFVCGP
jgi:hypothetical protein